ncbi:MAG: response regulator [Spirochaetales bacterium]
MGRTEKKVRIFSALEVANICGVVNQTAINWIKHGYLQAFTTPGGQYRVYSEDLVTFLKSRGMRIPAELQKVQQAIESELTVLVVDDDTDLNRLIVDYIVQKRPDLTVIQAFDGFEAGEKMVESSPGIVVLDVDLPGVDGRKLCRRLKSDRRGASPYVIAISGYADGTVEEQMLAEGADEFFAKPIDLADLLGSINAAREGAR